MKREEWKNIFAENLKTILDERGMSQKDLAEDSGIAASSINDYITKRQIPGAVSIINIAYALDMEVSDLIDFDERIE